MHDLLRRPLKELRISLTDRCNFRCVYCLPFEEYERIEKDSLLTFEEIERAARLFVGYGVETIHLTGGEPLLRRGIEDLVGRISAIQGLKDLCMVTNGSLLSEKAELLRKSGLQRITVSLDALDPIKFQSMVRREDLERVLCGLQKSKECGFHPIQLNAVILKGVNDGEVIPLVRYARENGFVIRFIEYMDVGHTNHWDIAKVLTKREILETVRSEFPLEEVGRNRAGSTSVRYRFLDGKGEMGIIASVTEPFCSQCARMRLTADGRLVTCLFQSQGFDLKEFLRRGSSDEEIHRFMDSVWSQRKDRYSEERWEKITQGRAPADRKNRIEMIQLGG
ncbi:MAG: GTP 3',8-cyclase MoaA [Elusimicrobia bacterium]|nr:GTP 3',8-cyclase MoaA [Elusimicrobiota bacterium]